MKGCVMKKLTTIISVLSLIAGCANTTDSTLEDFWRDTIDEQHSEEGTERLFSQASEVRIVKETPSQKVKTEIIVIDKPGGNFVVKIFQGGDQQAFLKKMREIFVQAKGFKPEACRTESFETYLVGINKK